MPVDEGGIVAVGFGHGEWGRRDGFFVVVVAHNSNLEVVLQPGDRVVVDVDLEIRHRPHLKIDPCWCQASVEDCDVEMPEITYITNLHQLKQSWERIV